MMEKKKTNLAISLLVAALSAAFFIGYYFSWQYPDSDGDSKINSIFSKSENAFFDPVLPDAPLLFPNDHQEHPSFQHEKWVMTINGIDQTGDPIAVQWSMFRVSNDDRETKGWLDPKLYISKVVITTKEKKWIGERLARGGIGQAGVNSRPYRVWIDEWQWRSLGTSPFPGAFSASDDGFSLKLSLNASSKAVPLGNDGYVKKHDLIPVASYEYMVPFLTARGNVTLDNKVYSFIGNGVLEHEWASGFLDEKQQGWDWFIINLNHETKLLVAQYRHEKQAPYRYGALLYKDGSHTLLSQDDISLQTLPARLLNNGRKLPLQWIINIPSYSINLTTQVLRAEQWLDTLIPYWQGPITTSGSHDVTGFMQLTGY